MNAVLPADHRACMAQLEGQEMQNLSRTISGVHSRFHDVQENYSHVVRHASFNGPWVIQQSVPVSVWTSSCSQTQFDDES